MLSEKLKKAIGLVKAGDKIAARQLLMEILNGEPTNETAWLWFTDTLNTDSEKKIALEGLLKINPNSQAAHLGLERLAARQAEINNPEPIQDMDRDDYQPLEKDILEESPIESPTVALPTRPITMDTDQVEAQPPVQTWEPTWPVNQPPTLPVTQPIAQPEPLPISQHEPLSLSQLEPQPAPLPAPRKKFALPASWGKLLVILLAVIVLGAGFYFFADSLGLFGPSAPACTCTDVNAYLLRAIDRQGRWVTNQTLYEFAAAHGDAPKNTDYAQQIYDEENKDSVPVCVNDLHKTLLTAFDYHIKYGEALRNKDSNGIQQYHDLEINIQTQLKQELQTIKSTLKCTP